MKAVVSTSIGEAHVEEVPDPSPDDDEALIAVERVQLSITECQMFEGTSDKDLDLLESRLDAGDNRLFGHEFSGVVTEVGDDVVEFSVGDRVYAPGKIKCGTCDYCRAGLDYLCSDTEIIGRHFPGALAEYIALPPEPLARLPDGVSFAEGATMQPLVSSYLIVNDTDIENGETVAVIGCGVMGFMCAQYAAEQGAGDVIAIDIDERKLSIAAEKGIIPVNAIDEDVEARVEALTDGIGVDVVFEAVGGPQDHASEGSDFLAQGFRMARPGGRLMQVGHVAGEVAVDPKWMRSKGVKWYNPVNDIQHLGPNANVRELVPELVATGRVSIEEYLTHSVDGLEAFRDAIDITLNKPEYDALSPAQIVLD